MSYGTEIMEMQMIEEADKLVSDERLQILIMLCDNRPKRRSHVKLWRQKNGELIAISDMTDRHLQNTIKMLKKQIDGSIHDEFVWDNVIAMEDELNRRKHKMKIQNVDLKVVGVTFTNENTGEKRADIIRELMDKDPKDIKIQLIREPENQYDMNAVKVLANDKQIGYIGKEYATIIAPLMDEYEEFSATVKGIGEYKNRPYCEITINQL
jgi:hypothetical protein